MLLRAQYPLEIIQTDSRITIVVELHNDVRRIFLDQRSVPVGMLPTWMGYSTGQWKNNELMIETSHIREKGLPRPQSPRLVVREQVRVVDGGDKGEMLEWQVTIDDPLIYSEPFTVTNYYRRYPNLEVGEYFCSGDLWQQNVDGRTGDYIPWR